MALRAFELQPGIERVPIEQGSKIETIEYCGNVLYIGTTDGVLMQYRLEESRSSTGRIDHQSVKEATKTLGHKSPITFIRAASALNRLLVLCDTSLFVLSMADLSVIPLAGSAKLKGVNACCVNENPATDNPFSVQMCLGKKKQLAIISITEERLAVEKIRELPDPILHVAMDGEFVCAALTSHYVIFNMASGRCQDLFPYEENSVPLISRVGKEEFLLNAPGGLGMFVTAEGMTERPPIQWMKPVAKFIYCHPYVVTLSYDLITVYSILDQQQKQSLHFSGGRSLGNFDGKLLVASSHSVYCILPIPVEVQIESLLDNGEIEAALDLAENVQHRGRNARERFQTLLNHVRQKAAFICFKTGELDRARELFIRGRVDPRELVSLYPRLLPMSSSFVRTAPPLHDLADINLLLRGDQDKVKEYRQFLVEYLEYTRISEGESFIYKVDVDTALIKLYSSDCPEKLVKYVQNESLICDFDDCKACLQKNSQHHALAILQRREGRIDQALGTWAAILANQLKDPAFPGLDFFISSLLSANDDLIWRYADFVLEKDEEKGVKIFMRPYDHDAERDEKVVKYLQKYSSAHLTYLEHLIHEKESKVEKFHTQLAVTYLEFIQNQIQSPKVDVAKVRSKFREFIMSSELIKAQYLLSRLEHTDMHHEKAILFGKLGEHEKALRILVHNLEDYKAAEVYCDQISSQKKLKQKLLTNLLAIYLDPSLDRDKQDRLSIPAMELLNRRASEMKGKDVVPLLPAHWSLHLVAPALMTLLETATHERRMTMIEANLAKSDNISQKYDHYLITKDPIIIQENSYCVVCKKPFTASPFLRYPNGIIVHKECVADESICPITGQVFKINET